MEFDEIVEMPSIDVQTQQRYQTWKANSVALYDYLNTYNHIWPSLTVQFFPDKDAAKDRRATYRLLTTTYTSASYPQQLQIGSITTKDFYEEASMSKFDEELHEFNTTDPIGGKYQLLQQLLLPTGVNRARMMPQNPDIISVICEDGSVNIYDKTKHASQETESKAEIRCKGHEQEGFGCDWNANDEAVLLTGALDGKLKLWDIKKIVPEQTLHQVQEWDCGVAVNDVEWCSEHRNMFISGDEENSVRLWDTREGTNTSVTTGGHNGGVNAVSWNKKNKFCVASGDGAGTVNIWDVRSFSEPVRTVKTHTGAVSSIAWNGTHGQLLATAGGEDSTVKILDMSANESVRFTHHGHLLGVNDIAWNPFDALMLASVSNDNTLHVWKPSVTLLS